MSPIRERVVNIIESLPYNIDKEILKRDIKEILQEITQKYVDTYGINRFIWKWQRMYKIFNWKYNLRKESDKYEY